MLDQCAVCFQSIANVFFLAVSDPFHFNVPGLILLQETDPGSKISRQVQIKDDKN